MKEIEIRFKVQDDKNLQEKINQLGAIKGEIEFQNDLYYKLKGHEDEGDVPGSSIYRIRQQSNNLVQLVRKTTITPGVWDEYEINIPKEHLDFFIDLFNTTMTQVLSISKHRTSYKINDFTICIDDIKNLGKFVEIELLSEDDDDYSRERIIKLAERLGIQEQDIITEGYVSLMKKKYNTK